jgi:hypothetical protein
MSLLDFLNTDDGRLGLGLLAAAGPTSQPMGFGERINMAMQGQDAYKTNQMRSKAAQMGLDKAQRDTDGELAIQQAARDSYGPQGFDQQAFLGRVSAFDPLQAQQFAQGWAKDESPLVLAPGSVALNRKTMQPMFTAPKEEAKPSAIKEYEYAQGQGFKGTFEQFQTAMKRAGAASTTVQMDNLGLKPKDRFEMEDKLRGDYSKATGDDQAIMTTAADIKNILAQNGALKDQAAIYKFAKALDPQGAVREADYAAIVKTAGGLDYVTNLVNKALTGEQLSPKQRKEMENVTGAMARVAEQRIGRQQQNYGKRAKMYNLTPENVFSAGGDNEWKILPGGQ